MLDTERSEVWLRVAIGRVESFDTLQFWLAATVPGFCLLAADAEQDPVLVAAGNRWFNLAVVDGDATTAEAPDRASRSGRKTHLRRLCPKG